MYFEGENNFILFMLWIMYNNGFIFSIYILRKECNGCIKVEVNRV